MPTSSPREFASQPGRPRRPEISRDPAPLRPIKPPATVERLFQVWLAQLVATLLALLGSLLIMLDAKRELLAARAQDPSAQQAVNLVLYGSLALLGLLLVLSALLQWRLRGRRGGRLLVTLLAVVQAASLPVLWETLGTASPQGLAISVLLVVAAVLHVAVAVWVWLPAVTAWLRS